MNDLEITIALCGILLIDAFGLIVLTNATLRRLRRIEGLLGARLKEGGYSLDVAKQKSSEK